MNRPLRLIPLLVTLFILSSVNGQEKILSTNVNTAIGKGIKYIISTQDSEGASKGAINDSYRNLTAMTSLATMAMAAAGHQPTDRTKTGRSMNDALEFVLKPDNLRQGYYFGGDGSRMYGHGITTLMLAEVLGMGVNDKQDRKVRQRLTKAIKLILASQRVNKHAYHQGGWRYSPGSHDADLSVSVWQIMALRSAKNAGLNVPEKSIQAAVEFIRRCYNARHGAFGYQPGGHPTYAMASAGLLSMQVCGKPKAKEVAAAAEWLSERQLNYHNHWFFYGTYYYSQGMFQRGGQPAKVARRRVARLLLQHQSDDGSWSANSGQESHAGKVYSTSLAILSLAVKNHYLPIYQR